MSKYPLEHDIQDIPSEDLLTNLPCNSANSSLKLHMTLALMKVTIDGEVWCTNSN